MNQFNEMTVEEQRELKREYENREGATKHHAFPVCFGCHMGQFCVKRTGGTCGLDVDCENHFRTTHYRKRNGGGRSPDILR